MFAVIFRVVGQYCVTLRGEHIAVKFLQRALAQWWGTLQIETDTGRLKESVKREVTPLRPTARRAGTWPGTNESSGGLGRRKNPSPL